jgi:aryl-alcohol dehydrogenase-like predicted oxidoreductase
MVQLSLLDRRAEEAILPALRGAGVPCLARGPVAQGLLAGRPARAYLGRDVDAVRRAQRALEDAVPDGVSPARAAVRYALDTPGVAMVVIGASSAAQLDETVAAAAMPPLEPDTRRALEEAAPALQYASHR